MYTHCLWWCLKWKSIIDCSFYEQHNCIEAYNFSEAQSEPSCVHVRRSAQKRRCRAYITEQLYMYDPHTYSLCKLITILKQCNTILHTWKTIICKPSFDYFFHKMHCHCNLHRTLYQIKKLWTAYKKIGTQSQVLIPFVVYFLALAVSLGLGISMALIILIIALVIVQQRRKIKRFSKTLLCFANYY